MPTAPIEVCGLTKRFGHFTALNGLNLRVEAGTVHGFLGPNGAGKSTTIRTLLGLYRRDAGQVTVLGRDPQQEASTITRQLAYIAGDVCLWPNFTGTQVLDALAALRGRRDKAREAELIERFELDPTKKVRTYSKGNRQKVALVAALAAPVDLFILDEPTSGLDPVMENVFTTVIEEIGARGATVLLSSHILAEVQALCTRVTIIKDGRVVEDGDLETLRSLAQTRIRLGAPGQAELLEAVARRLEEQAVAVERIGAHLQTAVEGSVVPTVLRVAAQAGLSDVRVEAASLEELFLRHYNGRAS